MGEYPRYERKMNPMMGVEEEITGAQLFGEVRIESLDSSAREKWQNYEDKLRHAAAGSGARNFSEENKARLLEEGYKIAEDLQDEKAGVNPSHRGLKDIRDNVREGLRLKPENERNLAVYGLLGTPLHKSFGFAGVVKFSEGGKPIYVPFEHEARRREAKNIAPVLIGEIPDPKDPEEKGKYQEVIRKTGRDIFNQILAVKKVGQMRSGAHHHRMF